MAKPIIYIDEFSPKKDLTCALYLRLFLNKKYIMLPMDISERIENFNKTTFQISGKGAKEKNLLLNRAIGTASDIILKYHVQKKTLTKKLFLDEFKNPAALTDFILFMYEQIKIRHGEIMQSTIDGQLSVWKKLKEYRMELFMAEMNEEFLRGFQNYMIRSLKLEPGTVHNNMKTIKTYVNRALRLKLIDNNPFIYFKLKKPSSEPEYLTEEERDRLKTIYKEGRLPDKYQKTLRWFLFSCYTGLRISDLRSVKHEDIQFDILQFRPIKTQNVTNLKVFIPLSKTAKWLIKEESLRTTGKLFECYSEMRMNLNIKDIAKYAKINRNFSFHTARHTFATIFLKKSKNANGIIILQKLLGHKKLESTLVYSHVLDADIRNAIEDFD